MKQDSYVTSSPASPPTVARVSDDTQSQGGADEYVIRHGGAFYRPNAQGYTYSLAEAWRLPKEEAGKYINNDPYHTVTIQSVGELVERVDHELEAASAKVNALLNMKAALQPRVSDGSPAGGKTGTGLIEDDSAAASAETPHPSPVDYTEVVERLNWSSVAVGTDGQWVSIRREVRDQAAQVIEAQAAEIERLEAKTIGVCDGCGTSWTITEIKREGAISCCPERKMLSAQEWYERAETAQARIAELEKERDEAAKETLPEAMDKSLMFVRDKLDEIKTGKGLIGLYYDAFRAGWFSASRASESRLKDAVKVIEEIASIPNGDDPGGLGIQRNAMLAAARSFLSTGGDSQ